MFVFCEFLSEAQQAVASALPYGENRRLWSITVSPNPYAWGLSHAWFIEHSGVYSLQQHPQEIGQCATQLRFPRLKEWAYAGAVFTYTGAAASHLAVGDGAGAPGPIIFAGIALAAPSRRGELPCACP
jgi:DoxX-like family